MGLSRKFSKKCFWDQTCYYNQLGSLPYCSIVQQFFILAYHKPQYTRPHWFASSDVPTAISSSSMILITEHETSKTQFHQINYHCSWIQSNTAENILEKDMKTFKKHAMHCKSVKCYYIHHRKPFFGQKIQLLLGKWKSASK